MSDFRTKLLNWTQRRGIAGFAVRRVFNLNPTYRRSGGRVTYVSEDLKTIKVKIPLKRSTRNYVGTIFGGSMFAATDPIYMFQLINLLGDEYVVWDKSSEIKFIRPGKQTLFYDFIITDNLLSEIQSEIATNNSYVFQLPVELKNSKNELVALVTKTIYTASKEHYKNRKTAKSTEEKGK